MKTGTLLASVLVVGSAVGHMATPSAVTACYEGGGPAEGYVHKETNLDFTVDRSSEKSVAFTESYNKFEGVSCSAVPAHKFGETAWCNTNGALCNRECPMSMPQKCADVDSFGVCTPTVKDICDTLQGSRDSCTSSSDAAQAKADDYLTVDVRASPCDGDEQSSTLNALKAYKVAYNNWATAFNNASQVCKVGETIRDYNGQSFMALHKNVDQVAKAAAAVCSEDDFNAEGSLPNLGSSEKNKAICEKMNNDLAKLSEDSQTSSKQIQCFSSKCQELSGKEATAFADMKAKFETFQDNYDEYFAAAEGFNAKVEDKNAKLAAVQAAHKQLAEVKAATGAKFTKDYEVYHKFETGAANGNCGLTACEMESVCGYDIEADASAYVEKDANGKCRGKTVDLVEHCYAEVADDKAKAAAEKVVKRTRVGEFVGGDPTKLRNAVISCEGRFGTDPDCDINTWDVSKMTSFNNLFKDLRWFNEPIGDWDTSQVTAMDRMFLRATAFNQFIGNWDTSKVTNFNDMFNGATAWNARYPGQSRP
jgi:hypothetical protein